MNSYRTVRVEVPTGLNTSSLTSFIMTGQEETDNRELFIKKNCYEAMSPLPFLLLSSSFSLPQNIDNFHIFFEMSQNKLFPSGKWKLSILFLEWLEMFSFFIK